MLLRFLKLCLFVVVVLLVPYYLPIVIFGREDAPPNVMLIWGIGLIMIFLAMVCIALLVAAYEYVINDSW